MSNRLEITEIGCGKNNWHSRTIIILEFRNTEKHQQVLVQFKASSLTWPASLCVNLLSIEPSESNGEYHSAKLVLGFSINTSFKLEPYNFRFSVMPALNKGTAVI
jgi:hypothetical protein